MAANRVSWISFNKYNFESKNFEERWDFDRRGITEALSPTQDFQYIYTGGATENSS